MKNYLKRSLVLLALAMPLSACEIYQETNLNSNKVQLEETEFSETVDISDMSGDVIAGLARDYSRYGDGPLDLTVLYDPSSRVSTAMKASSEAARIATAFRKNGVAMVETNILPIKGYGDDARAMVEYTAYNALAPKDCTQIAGLENNAIEVDPDYKLGCSIETVFAKQIARPKDLRGQQLDDTHDGRRSSNVIERYRTGVPNEPLEGEVSSE